jgi:hypothetical protein
VIEGSTRARSSKGTELKASVLAEIYDREAVSTSENDNVYRLLQPEVMAGQVSSANILTLLIHPHAKSNFSFFCAFVLLVIM